jgi:hypothetical protein
VRPQQAAREHEARRLRERGDGDARDDAHAQRAAEGGRAFGGRGRRGGRRARAGTSAGDRGEAGDEDGYVVGRSAQGTSTESSVGESRATTYSAGSSSDRLRTVCVSRGGT